MSYPHSQTPWPVTDATQERVRDWQGVSACELSDLFASYDAATGTHEPVTFDAVTLRWFRLMEVVGARDLDRYFGPVCEDAVL